MKKIMTSGASAGRALMVLAAGLTLLSAGFNWSAAHAADGPARANFLQEKASTDARRIGDWVVASGDNDGMPFVIVDKAQATVFVFYPDGRLRGAAPALLGLALGDDSAPGIGDRQLSSISPEERTTPAGRFVSALGYGLGGQHIVWVDYDAAISMHPVITSNPAERRLQRLATASSHDNRISYGCINVPVAFFNDVIRPTFTGTSGIFYILPEDRPISGVFPAYDVYGRVEAATHFPGDG